MANIFLNLPMPVGDGAGASVDTSAMGKDKSIVIGGLFTGSSVSIEISTDGVEFQGIHTFTSAGKEVLAVAAMAMRVFVRGRSAAPFSATCNIGANDVGALFFSLPVPAGDGAGTPVDVSTLGNFTTFVVTGDFNQAGVAIQVSEDGVDYATCVNFSGIGGQESKVVVGNFMRTFVQGRAGNGFPFTPVVAVGATLDAGGGGGGGGVTIPHIIQTGDGTASAGADAAVVIAHGAVLGGVSADVSALGSGAFAAGFVSSGGNATYAAYIEASASGTFASGHAERGGHVRADDKGAFAQGYTGYISRIFASDPGAFAQGYSSGQAGLALGQIQSTRTGSFAQGHAYNGTISARGMGSHASGYALGSGGVGVKIDCGTSAPGAFAHGSVRSRFTWSGQMDATDEGSIALGFVYSNTGSGTMNSRGPGSFCSGMVRAGTMRAGAASAGGSHAMGYAQDGGFIYSHGRGSFALGYADGKNGSSCRIEASSSGTFATGYVGYVGKIEAANSGDHAHGNAQGSGGSIYCTGGGSFAFGDVYGGLIEARGNGGNLAGGSCRSGGRIAAMVEGCFAWGRINGPYTIESNAKGAWAMGYADNANIYSSGEGAFAFGSAVGANISASAVNATQFGPGSNTLADSLQVGLAGIRFKGTVGAPGAPQNGDIWIVGTDVFIRTGGVSKNISSLT
jgi:hypothetical protein